MAAFTFGDGAGIGLRMMRDTLYWRAAVDGFGIPQFA
jgi:hypothetical protein